MADPKPLPDLPPLHIDDVTVDSCLLLAAGIVRQALYDARENPADAASQIRRGFLDLWLDALGIDPDGLAERVERMNTSTFGQRVIKGPSKFRRTAKDLSDAEILAAFAAVDFDANRAAKSIGMSRTGLRIAMLKRGLVRDGETFVQFGKRMAAQPRYAIAAE